ncbi:MAG: hypothetical protein Q8P53_03200 [Candidatus Shapirobacteria bacterium]|nr:hypothetical protein [Candidatus Shapirobacteria bacterium]
MTEIGIDNFDITSEFGLSGSIGTDRFVALVGIDSERAVTETIEELNINKGNNQESLEIRMGLLSVLEKLLIDKTELALPLLDAFLTDEDSGVRSITNIYLAQLSLVNPKMAAEKLKRSLKDTDIKPRAFAVISLVVLNEVSPDLAKPLLKQISRDKKMQGILDQMAKPGNVEKLMGLNLQTPNVDEFQFYFKSYFDGIRKK